MMMIDDDDDDEEDNDDDDDDDDRQSRLSYTYDSPLWPHAGLNMGMSWSYNLTIGGFIIIICWRP